MYDILIDRDEVQEGMFEELLELNHGPQMYVITNKNKVFGATAIIYPGVLMEFSKQKGDFYILPSSIHEGATRFAA